MCKQIEPIMPVNEIRASVYGIMHEIDQLCDAHGIILGRISAVRRYHDHNVTGSLADMLTDVLFQSLMAYDKFRTGQIEDLKRQVTELVMRMPPKPRNLQRPGSETI